MKWCEKCKNYVVCALTDKKPKCFTDRKTESNSENPNNSTTEDCSTVPTISKMEQVDKDINVRSKAEPQTNADQHVQRIESVESVEPTWTKEEHEAFYTFLWNVINPNEMEEYIAMFEAKTEPQTDCAWK